MTPSFALLFAGRAIAGITSASMALTGSAPAGAVTQSVTCHQ
jgi:hypothetical protein